MEVMREARTLCGREFGPLLQGSNLNVSIVGLGSLGLKEKFPLRRIQVGGFVDQLPFTQYFTWSWSTTNSRRFHCPWGFSTSPTGSR
jgi:hypothetical protein